MKKILLILYIVAVLSMVTSCKSKEECDFCGEMKYCEEHILFDDEEAKLFICEDCMNELEEEFGGE